MAVNQVSDQSLRFINSIKLIKRSSIITHTYTKSEPSELITCADLNLFQDWNYKTATCYANAWNEFICRRCSVYGNDVAKKHSISSNSSLLLVCISQSAASQGWQADTRQQMRDRVW